jgi:hypothetical protein
MHKIKSLAAVSALATAALFSTSANAVVFSPYTDGGGSAIIESVTMTGLIASYYVPDDSAESPPNSSPPAIEAFSETITGLSLTEADGPHPGCSGREGLGGNDGTTDRCAGNVFTVKLNDDAYFVFVYGAVLDVGEFSVSIFDSVRGKLSHVDIYNSVPSPIPVPPAAILLGSGLLGIGALARRKRKAA